MLSREDYQAYIGKNATWNFVVNMLDLTFFNLANSFIFGATILSFYASYLTDSKTLIGLIPAIQSVGFYLPQLLLSQRAERWERKRPKLQIISIFERAPYLVIGLSILLWPHAPKWFSFTILVLGVASATGAGGLGAPAWKAMLAKVIPAERRGLMFGMAQAFGGILGVAGAAASRWILQHFAYPTSYGLSFLICFVFQVCSWICLSLNREPPQAPTKKAVSTGEYFRRLPSVLRENPNFARYLAASAFVLLGGMATSFYVVYSREAFGIDDAFVAQLTIASLISQSVSTPILSWLGDRRGHKWLTEFVVLVGAAGIVLALLAPSKVWMYGVFMLVNVGVAGLSVASMSITMDFCGVEEMPTFTALGSTLLAVPILLAPILGGWLVDASGGYSLMFIVAAALMVLGFVGMHLFVKEPRHSENCA